MRTKVAYPGLKNSQKIRIIVDGFGFYTTVRDVEKICTSTHRAAVDSALVSLSSSISAGNKFRGFGSGITVYDDKLKSVRVDVQIDLMD